MAEKGWISRHAIQDEEVLEEHLGTGAVTTAKIGTNAVTAAKIAALASKVGHYGYDNYGYCVYG